MIATDHPVISPKKLIEVALPLDVINAASQREGFIYRGNPSALHKWWAQRPLAAARAVIYGQLVHDPEDLWRIQNLGVEPRPQNKSAWTRERARLFKIIEDLVLWENTTNEEVLEAARAEIRRSWRITCELNKDHPQAADLFNPDKMPSLHDPFAGGGTIPLEAQRLGLRAFASDLNPVAVLINKAIIEIPPKFAGRPPVYPDTRKNNQHQLQEWKGSSGLSEDVRCYGRWLRDEAEKRIGRLYPKITVTKAMAKDRPDLQDSVGDEVTVIAWLWARTVRSPNPAFADVHVPLASTFVLSSRAGRQVFAVPRRTSHGYSIEIHLGKPSSDAETGTSAGRQKGFRCLMSNTPISYQYAREEALAGRMGQRLLACVVETRSGRRYIQPSREHEDAAMAAKASWKPELQVPDQALGFRVQLYGMRTYGELFTERQATALSTFCDLLSEVQEKVRQDAYGLGLKDDRPLHLGGQGATAYAEAIATYLAFAIDKTAEYSCTIVPWFTKEDRPKGLFARQAIPMVWDFAEINTLATIGGTLLASVGIVAGALSGCDGQVGDGVAAQADAATGLAMPEGAVVSTDPPYYDNIGYADLSDFFYAWLRRSLRHTWPDLFATISVPKAEELIASPYRHQSKLLSEEFFLSGMTRAMRSLASKSHPALPVTIYYAFKQSETRAGLTSSSGWETFLSAVLASGLSVTGTWPMRTERAARSVSQGTNSLASCVVLVCQRRASSAGTISRRQFIRMLNEALPLALDKMTRVSEDDSVPSPVAPVDLSQAIIGPGMAIFSRYESVLEADGSPMTVKTALRLINRFLAEDDFDADTQFCLHWFEQHGWDEGRFGEADTLARAKGTSVDGVKQAGVLEAGAGKVRLLRWKEYPSDWNPLTDSRLPVWEALHQLIRAYRAEGESGAGRVLAGVARVAEPARQLAYRLYTLCERKGWAEEARAYNEVVTGWSAIETNAVKVAPQSQRTLFESPEPI